MRALKHAVSGITVTELPTHPAERALALQELLVIHATGGVSSDDDYRLLRQEFMARRDTERLLPPFVRRCRNLSAFWEWIKAEAKQWAPRRVLIREAFAGLLDYLEAGDRAPADETISGVLETFDEEGVHRAWVKALDRRLTDPEGAITSARTLLETVCKTILDAIGNGLYNDADDLPKLYHKTAERLKLAPSQHTEEAFKAILGSCQSVVNNLGTLRNRVGDAHGHGRKPVRPSKRHAALAVNLAGAMATFLIETHLAGGASERG
jgi:hypothetical protein